MCVEERLKTVGDVRRMLKGKPDDYPVVGTYYYNSGCDTCGAWDEEGDLVTCDLETRLVFEGRAPK